MTADSPAIHNESVPNNLTQRLRWHESLIFRGILIALALFMVGLGISCGLGIMGVNSIVRLAHDDAIDQALGDYMTQIREVHGLQQMLIVEKLRPYLASWAGLATVSNLPSRNLKERSNLSEKTIREWFDKTNLKTMTDLTKVEFSLASPPPTSSTTLVGSQNKILWLDKDRLQIANWIVEFPRGPLFEALKSAEELSKKQLLLGTTLNETIKPKIIKSYTALFFAVLFGAMILFLVVSRRVQARVQALLRGFVIWSESDPEFRFKGKGWQGELKLITNQFNLMAEEVEANRKRNVYLEKIASWQVIARKLAHEIKNPLTPIQMMVSQLRRRYKGDDDDFAQLLDDAQSIITEEVAGLRRMVDNFSDFARLPQPVLKPTVIPETCRQIVELQRVAFPKHDISFQSDVAFDAPEAIAVADDHLLRQVLINLIKNAAEACAEPEPYSADPSNTGPNASPTSSSSIGPRITVTYRANGFAAFVEVNDNGPGIPAEVQGHIFEAYVTTKHTGPSPGMGLGLAICQKIVMDHNGEISVKSQPGSTTFSIRLPRSGNDQEHPRTP